MCVSRSILNTRNESLLLPGDVRGGRFSIVMSFYRSLCSSKYSHTSIVSVFLSEDVCI
ncbi:unnamed protein product [Staurois parvus]|uniref:Uncharacterized protein n=1 Tax=Staurois parvus TaxID=386267 RepID=A0ABN9DS89_9NEOB|nr:unnamed protein product [Staurois parvus]